MNDFVIAAMLFFVAVLVLVLVFGEGKLKCLGKKLKIGPQGITVAPAENTRKFYPRRKFENLAFLIFGLCTFKLADFISNYLFLCILYGVSRVQSEKLHFASGHRWIVSNGDQITTDVRPLYFVLCAVIWLVPTLVGFVVIRRLLPERKEADSSRGNQSMIQEHLAQKPMERRSFLEKGRPFRMRSLLFMAYWVLAMVPLFVFSYTIGWVVLVLIPGVSIILYVIYTRSRGRHFVSMLVTTPCSQCGQVPLRYEPPTNKNGMTHLLICDKCHIEWDLGSI